MKRALGYLWALPYTILCLPLLLIYWPIAIRFKGGCIEMQTLRIIPSWASAQALGLIVCYNVEWGWSDPMTRAHEYEHVRQAMRWGLLFPILYALESLVCVMGGRNPYTDNCFEVDARAAAMSLIDGPYRSEDLHV